MVFSSNELEVRAFLNTGYQCSLWYVCSSAMSLLKHHLLSAIVFPCIVLPSWPWISGLCDGLHTGANNTIGISVWHSLCPGEGQLVYYVKNHWQSNRHPQQAIVTAQKYIMWQSCAGFWGQMWSFDKEGVPKVDELKKKGMNPIFSI